MRIKRRLTVLVAACVGLATLAACVAAYVAVRAELFGQIDDALRASAPRRGEMVRQPETPPDQTRRLREPGPRRGGPAGYIQFISTSGTVRRARGDLRLPVDATTRAIARRGSGTSGPRTVKVDGAPLRVYSFGVSGAGAVQVARSLDPTNRVLSRLRLVLVFVLLGGIALAAALARRVGGRFGVLVRDLGRSNAALDEALSAQRQLVADASHELRTPVTSLRTNVEVLLEGDELDAESRAGLLDDVREQTEELGLLVSDLIELARGDVQGSEPQDVRLDELAEEAAARARRHAPPGVGVVVHAEPVALEGVPERLGRAINNLLDNAIRHAARETDVELTVARDGVTVRDRGPGLDEADIPQLFDRFYRGASARRGSGSGLGLAIVRQVAESHGGAVSAANASDGGAIFHLRLPGARPVGETTPTRQLSRQ